MSSWNSLVQQLRIDSVILWSQLWFSQLDSLELDPLDFLGALKPQDNLQIRLPGQPDVVWFLSLIRQQVRYHCCPQHDGLQMKSWFLSSRSCTWVDRLFSRATKLDPCVSSTRNLGLFLFRKNFSMLLDQVLPDINFDFCCWNPTTHF